MPPLRTLIFYPALAPYRVDMFNALAERLELKVVFLREHVSYQKYDQKNLRARCRFHHDFLVNGFDFGIHMIRSGVGRRIAAFRPRVVACAEYGVIAQEIGMRRHLPKAARWGMTIFTEDNAVICREEKPLRRIMRSMALAYTDTLVTYTHAGKDWFASHGLRPEQVAVSPNIQSEAAFRNRLEHALPVAAEYARRHHLAGRRIALCVARLVEVKGLDRLIAAFARIAPELPDASLILVGEGPEEASLRAAAARLGLRERVLFAGHHEAERLAAWYHTAHVFALASHFEPYGAVVNESLLAGVPVVCSSRAGAADLIRGEAQGCVVDPHDIPAIAHALRRGLAAARPLDPDALAVRPSLMPVTFPEAVDALVGAFETAADRS